MRRLLPYDELLGIRRVFNMDEDDHWTVHTEQDVTELIEFNKAEFNLHGDHFTWRGEHFHRAARMPLNIYAHLMRIGLARDDKAFLRWLDDPGVRAWRTRPGKLSR